jgi:hypothetical protein
LFCNQINQTKTTNMTNSKKQEAIETLKELFEDYGMAPLTESELKDYSINGDETYDQLKEIASDFANEYASYKAEIKSKYYL